MADEWNSPHSTFFQSKNDWKITKYITNHF